MSKLVTYTLVRKGDDDWSYTEIEPYPSYHRFAEQAGRVVHYESVGSYQGNHVFGLKNEHGTPGILILAFGSCSYCDAIQSARDYAESVRDITALRDQAVASVVWGKRAIKRRDWNGSWYTYDPEMVEAINKTLAAIGVDFELEIDDD